MARLLVDLVEERDDEGAGLARAVLGAGDDALAGDDEGDGLLLDGGGDEVAGLGEGEDDVLLQLQFDEVLVLGGADVLRGCGGTFVCSRSSVLISLFSFSESLSIIAPVPL